MLDSSFFNPDEFQGVGPSRADIQDHLDEARKALAGRRSRCTVRPRIDGAGPVALLANIDEPEFRNVIPIAAPLDFVGRGRAITRHRWGRNVYLVEGAQWLFYFRDGEMFVSDAGSTNGSLLGSARGTECVPRYRWRGASGDWDFDSVERRLDRVGINDEWLPVSEGDLLRWVLGIHVFGWI